MFKGLLTTDCGIRTDRGRAPLRVKLRGAADARKIRSREASAGFTLIELLVVVSIIGILATTGTVSYSSARSKARDAKRVSDSRQLQTAIEIYFEVNSTYPPDGRVGRQGVALGEPDTVVFSDAGFSSEQRGQVYMIMVPKNPTPYGAPYVYRSLNADGTDCNFAPCDAFELLFFLEKGSVDLKAGVNAVTQDGLTSRPDGYDGQDVTVSLPEGFARVEESVDWYASEGARLAAGIAGNETVQQITEKAVAPAAGAAALLNTVVAAGPGLYNFAFFLVQPLRLLRRRRGQAWGVVYNSLSRLPEDLAIVRLKDSRTNRIVRSQVTDSAGRYSFLVGPGIYRLEVSKFGYTFPSHVVEGEVDGPYAEVYRGGSFDVRSEGNVVAFNIPLDPPEAPATDAAVRSKTARLARRRNLAVLPLGIGFLAFALRPTAMTGLLLGAQFVTYLIFKRLAEPSEPKTWGTVFDQDTGRPVAQAIVRVFEDKYNKLLETQVTDSAGRYHFRVGRNTYHLTVSKPGYFKTETTPFDLTGGEEAVVIASDLPLRRDLGAEIEPPKAVLPPAPPPPVGTVAPPKPPPPPPVATTGVSSSDKAGGTVDLFSILPNYFSNGAGGTSVQTPDASVSHEPAAPEVTAAPEPEPAAAPPSPPEPPKKAWFRDF